MPDKWVLRHDVRDFDHECSYFTAYFPIKSEGQARARYCTVEITFDPSFHTRRHVLREFSDELSSKERKFKAVGRDGQETPIVFRSPKDKSYQRGNFGH
jgi:hypothetical protein